MHGFCIFEKFRINLLIILTIHNFTTQLELELEQFKLELEQFKLNFNSSNWIELEQSKLEPD